MNKFEEILDPAMGEFKAEVLKEVRDLKTRIPELQGTGSCKILEVGVGSGKCTTNWIKTNWRREEGYEANEI